MEETILVCEDCLEGVLTAIYRAYEWRLRPDCVRIQLGEDDLCLFASYREVAPDTAAAQKVARTIRRRFGEDAWRHICCALAAEDREKGQAVYRTIAAGLSGQIRGPLMEALANDAVRQVFALSRNVSNEAHRMKEFLRFRETEGKLLLARIEPRADVMEFIMPHFADRFPLENFLILDVRRNVAGVHAAQRDWFLAGLEERQAEKISSMAGHVTQQEEEMAALFRRFCQSVAIQERENTKLQQQFLPLKYRWYMTEFEKSS